MAAPFETLTMVAEDNEVLPLSTDDESTFGDLRALLHEEPTLERWASLLTLLNRWSTDDDALEAEILPYVEGVLEEHWPDVVRRLPENWLARLRRGESVPMMRLIRSIHRPRPHRHARGVVILTDLARQPDLAGLRHIHLAGERFGDEGLLALLDSPHLGPLRHLGLEEDEIGDEGLQALADSERLGELEELDLAANFFGPSGLEALAGARTLGKLQRLGLSFCEIEPDALEPLLALEGALPSLHTLDLRGNALRGDLLEALLEVEGLERLEGLDLGDNGLGDEEARALADHAAIQQLRWLRIADNDLTAEGLEALIDAAAMADCEVITTTRPEPEGDFRLYEVIRREYQLGR